MFRKSTIEIKKYKSDKAYKKDVKRMARKGWLVQSVAAQQDGRSKKSWLALGAFNFARKQKVALTVTYTRA